MSLFSRSIAFTMLLLAAGMASALDLAVVMKRLAAEPGAKVEYREQKHSSLLATPVESAGTLSYQRPDVVEKNVATPRAERFRIAGDTLSVTRAGKERRIPLSSQPLLAAFAASLRGVLAGDEKQLREYFRLAASGTEAQWQLDLTPIDDEVAQAVERVTITGRAGKVATIEVREAGGDRSLLQVR